MQEELPSSLIECAREDLLPLVLEACEDARSIFAIRPARLDEACVGYLCWRHIFNGVQGTHLRKKGWELSLAENDLVVSTNLGGASYRLRICRVDPRTRLPRSKRARDSAQGSGILPSEELIKLLENKSELIIGYDTTGISGVGKVAIQKLYTNGSSIWTNVLEILYDVTRVTTEVELIAEESIPHRKPVRKATENNDTKREGIVKRG